MTVPLVVVGCGGHGREVLTIARAMDVAAGRPRWRLLGFVDDRPSEENLKRVQRLDVPYLGGVAWLRDAPPDAHHVIGIGDPRVRRAVAARVEAYGTPAASLVHPAATIGPDTVHGPGFVAFAGARVTTNVTARPARAPQPERHGRARLHPRRLRLGQPAGRRLRRLPPGGGGAGRHDGRRAAGPAGGPGQHRRGGRLRRPGRAGRCRVKGVPAR